MDNLSERSTDRHGLEDSGDDLTNYLERHHEKISNPTQFRIVFNRKLNNMHSMIRDLQFDDIMPLNDKITLYSKIYNKLQRCQNLFPLDDEYLDLWMDLCSVSNELILQIASLGRDAQQWRMLASVNILTTLLSGVPKMDKLPQVKIIQMEGQYNRLMKIRNILSSTTGVYVESILTLDTIDENDLIKWCESAFWHFSLYIKFIEEVDFGRIIATIRDRQDGLIQQVNYYLTPLWNLVLLVLELLRIYGEDMPKINTHGVLHLGYKGFIKFLHWYQIQIAIELERIKNYPEGNRDLKGSSQYKELLIIHSVAGIISEVVETYAGVKRGRKLDEELIEKFRRLCEKIHEHINIIWGDMDVENVYIGYFKILYSFYVELSLYQEVTYADVEFAERIQFDYTELYLKYHKIILLKSLMNGEESLYPYSTAENFFKFHPRDLLDVYIIKLLQCRVERRSTSEIEALIESHIKENIHNDRYREFIVGYLKHLRTGDPLQIQMPKFIALDHKTWFNNQTIAGRKYLSVNADQFSIYH